MASGKPPRKLTRGGLAPWQVERALELLSSETSADHRVVRVADACGLSRSYFGRAFKASTGLSPHQWLLRDRVRRAAELLEVSEETISTIALHCGFADQSHMTRVFHKMTGFSPADWRRQRLFNRDF